METVTDFVTVGSEAVAALTVAVRPGLDELGPAELAVLLKATSRVREARGQEGREELGRFRKIHDRGLRIDVDALRSLHEGRTVLITGGTGCVGSALVRELDGLGARRVVSVSRGSERRWPRSDQVEYHHLDVRDRGALLELFAGVKPDIVYHLAAQHDPGLAELEIHRTLSTNVTGTVNVAEACRLNPGTRLACASTGKALRPFSRDVYAASKKMTEWVLGAAATNDATIVSAVRFTHVVDNSIILRRLYGWTGRGEAIRLHSTESMFYLQSAREAAQLLMSSQLDAATGAICIAAIRDLGWPISLLDLAVGVISESPCESPLYVCGREPGYEKAMYPGLYDPQISGGRSPLFSALEAYDVIDSGGCVDIDLYRPRHRPDVEISDSISALSHQAASTSAAELRELVAGVGWAMLRNRLQQLSADVLVRHSLLLESCSAEEFSEDDVTVRAMVDAENSRRLDFESEMSFVDTKVCAPALHRAGW